MQEFKFQRFVVDQVHNPELQYHIGRFLLSYGEASFTLNFFANGLFSFFDAYFTLLDT